MSDKCEVGCRVYTGFERYHHKDCVYYPESMSRLFDESKEKMGVLEKALEFYAETWNWPGGHGDPGNPNMGSSIARKALGMK